MSFLDRLPPYDFGDSAARDLWQLLYQNYGARAATQDLLTRAGVDPGEINFEQAPRWIWREILLLAHAKGRLRGLLELVIGDMDPAVGARVAELTSESPVVAMPTLAIGSAWRGGTADDAYERIVFGQSTLLDVAFLKQGLELATSVCRLLVTIGDDRFYGTGFRITDDYILTNQHNLFADGSADHPASHVEAAFAYERSFAGAPSAPHTLVGDTASIHANIGHDWAIIKLRGDFPKTCAKVPVTPSPKVRIDDRVYIIQHPHGGPKQIGMIHNVVRSVEADEIQYLTDTEEGSSGSPVFNERWELVGIHQKSEARSKGGIVEIKNIGRTILPVARELIDLGIVRAS